MAAYRQYLFNVFLDSEDDSPEQDAALARYLAFIATVDRYAS